MPASSYSEVPLNQMFLSLENPRFDPVNSQVDAIDTMLSNQGENLVRLAEDILKNGLNPNDLIMVTPVDEGYEVLEGNRRVTAMKTVSNPALAKNETLRKRFQKLKDDFPTEIEDIDQIFCAIYDDPQDAYHWVNLKHTGENRGIGIDDWDPLQKQRFAAIMGRTSSFAFQAVEFLRQHPNTTDEEKEGLKIIPSSTFTRLLSSPKVQNVVGVLLQRGELYSIYSPGAIAVPLLKIAKDLYTKEIKVDAVKSAEQREDYADSLADENLLDRTVEAESPWKLSQPETFKVKQASPRPADSQPSAEGDNASGASNAGTTGSASDGTGAQGDNTSTQGSGSTDGNSGAKNTTPKKAKVNPKERSTLIPITCRMQINAAKINAIYHDLQKIDCNKYTNSCAVLLRVFLELSVDAYIKDKNINIPSTQQTLAGKIKEVVTRFKSNTHGPVEAHDLEGAQLAAIESNSTFSLFSTRTLHQYVHNVSFTPSAADIKATWDKLEPFIKLIWSNIN